MTAFLLRVFARGDWGRAMLAELAALEDAGERRRFALGCLRALLIRPATWLHLATFALVAAVPALLFTGPGHGGSVTGVCVVGAATLACLVAVARADPSPAAFAGALLWWAALLLSATVRAHPQWALLVIAASAVVARHRALSTAFVACLAVFVVSVGTYATLPRLAPPIAPANATDPQLENAIESTDPYVGELLLAMLLGLALVAPTVDVSKSVRKHQGGRG